MDKQRIIASVNPKKKKNTNRKEAAAKLREGSFNQAYQKNKVEEIKTDTIQPAEQANERKEEISQPIEKKEETITTNNAELSSEAVQEEGLPAEMTSLSKSKVKSRRGPKKAKKKEGVGEIVYATITVPQNVSKIVKLASTMMEENKLDFTTDAVRHYIKYLKKSGQLPDMPTLDL